MINDNKERGVSGSCRRVRKSERGNLRRGESGREAGSENRGNKGSGVSSSKVDTFTCKVKGA